MGECMASNLSSHLHRSRYGVFYFRRAVPPDLRGYFPSRELYRSLRTSNRVEANRLVRLVSARVEFAFIFLRRYMPDKDKTDITAGLDYRNRLRRRRPTKMRFERQSHDTPEEAHVALQEALRTFAQLPARSRSDDYANPASQWP